MTDYLHSLLIKHFKRAELIQPRLLSLFEPPQITPEAIDQRNLGSELPDAVSAPTGHRAEDMTAAQNLAQQSFIHQTVAAAPQLPDAILSMLKAAAFSPLPPKSADAPARAPQLEATPGQATLDAIESGTNAAALPNLGQRLRPEPISTQQRALHSSSRWATQAARSQLRHAENSTRPTSNERVESQSQSLRPPQVAKLTPDENIVQPPGSRVLTPLTSHPSASSEIKIGRTLQPVSSPGETETREAPIAITGQSRLVPAPPTDRAAALPTTPPAAPPLVRVTIGRVEVQAIMPPLPPPRPAPTRRAVPLSLAKYLKQVNGQR